MKIREKSREPFFYPGNRTGCLLVHGFTSSPAEMAYLGEQLAEEGYSVNGVLLAGHGHTPADLQQVTWADWYKSVVDGYQQLEEICDQVFIIGLSMGGALALYAASQLSVQGVVAICAPIYLVDKKSMLTPYFQHFVPFYLKDKSNQAEIVTDKYGRYSYNKVPLKAVANLLQLIKNLKVSLPQVTAPGLIMQSTRDNIVEPDSATYIFRHLGSQEKELVWLERSGHLATVDMDREKVAQLVIKFIQDKDLGGN